ncbi:MAG: RsmB/NOP family class I SAM-dependent RNA methyltransferase [Hyphomicrobiaceae bacterium]|nr:RsmB/NOP family class I SAM-dependent RNA methyltransferase [Hyphomicrobiaceae bacterium]
MRTGARLRAAAEVLADVLERHRPASMALADWGKAHRFAGSGDRNAIGGLVYDALRRKSSIAWAAGTDAPRALALGAAVAALAISAEAVVAACDGEGHALEPLSPDEVAALSRPIDDAPDYVRADVPEWLWSSFQRSFADRSVAEGQALAMRAPTDLRVNALKATREKLLKALRDYGAEPTRLAPDGVRVPAPVGPARTPNLQAEAAFQAGWFEIQDEGSQIAARLTGAGPRIQVLDLCAGGGGKTLAMAAAMQNTGQIYAYDADRLRLKPIFDRVKRAGVRNAQVLRGGDEAALLALGPRFDVVLVDAPCTGTGVWRRRPEAKWRLKDTNVVERMAEQRQILDLAATLVKPGGQLIYVTCSLLPEENFDQVRQFLERMDDFMLADWQEAWRQRVGTDPPPAAAAARDEGLLLAPALHGTDGFFVSILQKAGL